MDQDQTPPLIEGRRLKEPQGHFREKSRWISLSTTYQALLMTSLIFKAVSGLTNFAQNFPTISNEL